MVEQCVDQCPVKIARSGMDDQARRLVDNKQMLVLMDNIERNFLRRGMVRDWFRHLETETLIALHLDRWIPHRTCGAPQGALTDQLLDPFAGQRRHDIRAGAIKAPATMLSLERDLIRPPGHFADMASIDGGSMAQGGCPSLRPPASMAAMNDIDFAALLCSRLCHDLLSPVGALNNGLELMADEQDPEMRERCMELLSDSARSTAAKLKFFRLAFGSAGGYGAEIDTGEAKAALQGLFGPEKRIELGWLVAEPKLPKDAVKLLLNLGMIAGDGLVRGGRLDIGAEKGANLELVVRAEGERLVMDPAIRKVLAEGARPEEVEPRTAAAYLANRLAGNFGGTVRLSPEGEAALVMGVSLPA